VVIPPDLKVHAALYRELEAAGHEVGLHTHPAEQGYVDAKNHWYTIQKNVKRQVAAGEAIPVKHLKALTHNIFDYSSPHDFRRETLLGVITAARQICEQQGCALVPATTGEIAAEYRRRAPLPRGGVRLELDTRGRAAWTAKKFT
jgi:hypothetical protein